ncbi:hypothetical protein [Kineothrix sedimenti]|uniref:Uncharacterized protein n=1 Tax=Kineothrix sedimenti TaxID=3123317 RepID=A0ABZ3ESG3_9FIRM
MNKSNSHAQNNHIQTAGNNRRLYQIERDVSDYAKKVNSRKPFYMAGKGKEWNINA